MAEVAGEGGGRESDRMERWAEAEGECHVAVERRREEA